MASATKELLARFDTLPSKERALVAREIWRRTRPFDSGPVDDKELARAADDVSALLDQEENHATARPKSR